MDNRLDIILTGDGSQTILDKARDTTYHSTNGAITESKHVFIEAGLKYVMAKGAKEVRILEMGFGTGLNAFLSYLEVSSSKDKLSNSETDVVYFGIEANPLPHSIVKQLVYPDFLYASHADSIFRQMHRASIIKEPGFALEVLRGKIEDLELPRDISLVYYDAFGPGDQSEMWELEILSKIISSMAPDGILVTYCAQGQFKRNLKKLGCEVESLPGPPGKREMVRATLRKT